MPRKQHNTESGYVAERGNDLFPTPRPKVAVYRAAEQGIDAAAKYAVVCDAHGQIGEATSVPAARRLMRRPSEFCTACRAMEAAVQA